MDGLVSRQVDSMGKLYTSGEDLVASSILYFLHCLEFETLLKSFFWPYIALQDLTVEESALMPNTMGAKSVHSAMQKCPSQRKVGLLEACKMDQNWAVSEIAA
jgi:hypothetical protein